MKRKWLNDRIEELRPKGKSKAGLARALKLDPARIHEMIKDDRKIAAAEIPPMAAYLELPVDDVLRLAGVLPASIADALDDEPLPPTNVAIGDVPPAPDRQSMPKNVEVLGTAVGGREGDFMFNGGVIDMVRRPPSIANLKRVAAIYVAGESMVPWREPGDLVYFTDLRPARPGDYVIVEMMPKRAGEPGAALLKRLVGRSGTKIRLAQYNPPDDRIEVPAGNVKTIFRVIDWSELYGA